MIKRVSFIRRKEGMTADEFYAHWTGPHAEIVKNMPGLRGLRYCRVTNWTPEEAGWDGIGEIWFDSVEDAKKAFAAEPFASQLAADRPKFMREAQSCFVEEHTTVAPPEGR